METPTTHGFAGTCGQLSDSADNLRTENPAPTPETDALIVAKSGFGPTDFEWRTHARRLERERDVANKLLTGSKRARASLSQACDHLQCELLEARAEIAAMRTALNEAYDALKFWPKAGSGMSTDFIKQSEAFRAGQDALTKLQPFIKP